MRTIICRWLMFGMLIGWSLSHANVLGQQQTSKTYDAKTEVSADKLRQNLDKTITVDYTGQSLADTLNHLREKTGLAISIDQTSLAMMGINADAVTLGGDVQRYSIKATNEKASQVLRKFLSAHQLSYILIEDAVLVTSEEMAIVRQMTQRVSVDLEDVPFKKAVRELAKKHGINLVIDPKVLVQADTLVTLQVENTGIETAVRLLAEMASLKAVRMGNVMFVTNEEKAKKIRDEEKHQFDNPLNPGVPGPMMYPQAMRAVGGFPQVGGGVMPVCAPGPLPPGGFPPPIIAPAVPIAPPPPNPPIELPQPPRNAPGVSPPVQPFPSPANERPTPPSPPTKY